MSRCSQIVRQMITAAALVSAAPHTQASPSTAYVSVCCNAPSTADVFFASTLQQTRTIVTGSGGDGMVLSPDGKKMFVTVDYKRQLQVIETATGAILARVPVPISISGTPPLELAISPDGERVYVMAPQAAPAVLLAIDTTTYSVTNKSNPPAGGTLGPLMVSPDGTQLYFEVGYVAEYIQVLDASTLAPVKQIPVPGGVIPTDLAITPNGLILMTDSSSQLLVIDPQSSDVTVFYVSNSHGAPANVISSPDSTTAYLSVPEPPAILALNIATGATIFEASISEIPTNFAISPDGSTLYSSNRSMGGAWSLSEFSIPEQKDLATVRQLGPITGVGLSGQDLYVLNANQSAVAAVDVASEKMTHVKLGGVDLNSLAIGPAGAVWASQYSFGLGGETIFLNPATWQSNFLANISGAIVFSPTGNVVYFYNPGGVTAYDVSSLAPIGSASVGQLTNLDQVIPSPDGTRLYMSVSFISGASNGDVLLGPGAIYVLDTSTFKYIASVNVPDGMGGMALTPDGSTLVYTVNYGRIRLLSTSTYKITETVQLKPTSGYLPALALSPDGSTAYAADAVNNLLLVADLQNQTQTASIAVGRYPSPVVVTPDGTEAWVATEAGLEIVKTATGQVSSVALPGEPSAIVFAP
jgi:YVTN family beta-propeller protein